MKICWNFSNHPCVNLGKFNSQFFAADAGLLYWDRFWVKFGEYCLDFDFKQKFKGDKAYLRENLITTPINKPRHRELTIGQKEQNKAFSAKQIFLEHHLAQSKYFDPRFCMSSYAYCNARSSNLISRRSIPNLHPYGDWDTCLLKLMLLLHYLI